MRFQILDFLTLHLSRNFTTVSYNVENNIASHYLALPAIHWITMKTRNAYVPLSNIPSDSRERDTKSRWAEIKPALGEAATSRVDLLFYSTFTIAPSK